MYLRINLSTEPREDRRGVVLQSSLLVRHNTKLPSVAHHSSMPPPDRRANHVVYEDSEYALFTKHMSRR